MLISIHKNANKLPDLCGAGLVCDSNCSYVAASLAPGAILYFPFIDCIAELTFPVGMFVGTVVCSWCHGIELVGLLCL